MTVTAFVCEENINRVKCVSNSYPPKTQKITMKSIEKPILFSPVNLGYVLNRLVNLSKKRIDFFDRQYLMGAIEKVKNYYDQKPQDYFQEFSKILTKIVILETKYEKNN